MSTSTTSSKDPSLSMSSESSSSSSRPTSQRTHVSTPSMSGNGAVLTDDQIYAVASAAARAAVESTPSALDKSQTHIIFRAAVAAAAAAASTAATAIALSPTWDITTTTTPSSSSGSNLGATGGISQRKHGSKAGSAYATHPSDTHMIVTPGVDTTCNEGSERHLFERNDDSSVMTETPATGASSTHSAASIASATSIRPTATVPKTSVPVLSPNRRANATKQTSLSQHKEADEIERPPLISNISPPRPKHQRLMQPHSHPGKRPPAKTRTPTALAGGMATSRNTPTTSVASASVVRQTGSGMILNAASKLYHSLPKPPQQPQLARGKAREWA